MIYLRKDIENTHILIETHFAVPEKAQPFQHLTNHVLKEEREWHHCRSMLLTYLARYSYYHLTDGIEGRDAFAEEIRVLGMESLGVKQSIRFGKGEHKTYI